jgi:hypothetical protein
MQPMLGGRCVRTLTMFAIAVLALGACGGDSKAATPPRPRQTTTTTTPVDTAIVDGAIDNVVDALKVLNHLNVTSVPDLLAQFQVATGDLRAATATLEHGVSGVPDSAIEPNIAALTSMAASLDAAVGCFRSVSPLDPAPCSSTSSLVGERATAAGTAMAKLIPYGTRSSTEVVALIN